MTKAKLQHNLDLCDRLRSAVSKALPLLSAIGNEEASQSEPERWSRKEILGHLIDSATNNHQRFVRAQYEGHLIFSGYEQERWVELQGYRDAVWPDLIELWSRYNLHLAIIIDKIPDDKLYKATTDHNFHQIAWQQTSEGCNSNLAYFIADYIDHMEHHLGQIFSRH